MKNLVLLICSLLFFIIFVAKGNEFYTDKRIKIAIVSGNEKISKGDTNLFAIKVSLARGWHIYWLNPGDAGEAPVFEITTNINKESVIAPKHPIPSYRNTKGIVTLEHSGVVYFPFEVYIPEDFFGNTLDINLNAKWLVCKEKCIPGEAKIKKIFPLDKKISKRNYQPKIGKIYQKILLDTLRAEFQFSDEYAIMYVDLPNIEKINKVFFYPSTQGLFDLEIKPKFLYEKGQISVELPLLQYLWGEKDKVEGILELKLMDKSKKYFWVQYVNTK